MISIDDGRRVPGDEHVLLSNNAVHLPLRMVHSRSAGSEKRSMLLIASGTAGHAPEKTRKKYYQFLEVTKT